MARILVAEDEASVRAFVVRALRHHGHEVQEAADGAAALELLGAGEFDLLLTDIVMPVMDGIALALAASRDHPKVRILMMTGFADQKRRAHNLSALIHDVIDKPFSLSQLVAAVDRALA
jgi:CheY-like chemotaxis protein